MSDPHLHVVLFLTGQLFGGLLMALTVWYATRNKGDQ